MATTRLTIKREDDKFIITSNDDHIKQVFFSWASFGTGLGIDEYPEFYGQSIEKPNRMSGGHDRWQWSLDERLMRKMIKNLTNGDPSADDNEKKASSVVFYELSAALTDKETPDGLDEFTTAYLVAALWSTNDNSDESGGQPLDLNYDIWDIAPEAMRSAMESCAEFQEQHKELLATAYELYTPRDGYHGPALAGHDLWLTAAGHGAGYWDRGLGDVGKALTDAARKFGECYIEVGDDGLIYGF